MSNGTNDKTILVTGATGYVGGRLVPRLIDAGYRVRAVGRSLDKLSARPWAKHPQVELMTADLLDPADCNKACQGCNGAYYLVHSMNPDARDFETADRQAAQQFIASAQHAGLEQVIYLGGLGENDESLSKHLRSRAEVADIFHHSPVNSTVFRAAMIIGSGSASFEILRYLVDRLPIMITPKWVDTQCQPIAIRNVLEYLVAGLLNPATYNLQLDIGGPDVMTYRELMTTYAEVSRLKKRFIIPVPVFTPKLSSYWIHCITPVPSYIAQPLAEGLRNPVICSEQNAQNITPIHLIPCEEAIQRALQRVTQHQVETHWADAGKLSFPEWLFPGDPKWAGGTLYQDCRSKVIPASPESVWQPILALGGQNGYYYGNWLWHIRGILDLMFGGVGLKRGRKHPTQLSPGDILDFWRVLKIKPNEQLTLIAEMKLPGEAILEFKLLRLDNGATQLQQNAYFIPRGLLGILYWYSVMPLHNAVFNGMLNGIAKACRPLSD